MLTDSSDEGIFVAIGGWKDDMTILYRKDNSRNVAIVSI